MRKVVIVLLLCSALRWLGRSIQYPDRASRTKPPVHHAAAWARRLPIIETTVGKMTCTLFPDKAPIGVAELYRPRHRQRKTGRIRSAESPSMACRSTTAPFFIA